MYIRIRNSYFKQSLNTANFLRPSFKAGAIGSAGLIGYVGGGLGGAAIGSMWNPDEIDPETGEQVRLNPAQRTGAILGGSFIGSKVGGLGGLGTGMLMNRRR